MPLNPPLCLPVTGFVNAYLNTNGIANYYGYTVSIVSPQQYSAGGYDLASVSMGMYISTDSSDSGYSFRIVQVITSNSDPITGIQPLSLTDPVTGDMYYDTQGGGYVIDLIIEDVNNYNAKVSPFAAGGPNDNVGGYIYEVNSLGLPLLTSIQNPPTSNFGVEQLSRFLATTVSDGSKIVVTQPGFTVRVGDTVWLNPNAAGGAAYESINNTTTTLTNGIGIVSSIGYPDADSFQIAPYGTYYENVSSYYKDYINTGNTFKLSTISGATKGSYIYINSDSASPDNYTIVPNGNPVWLYMGIDPRSNYDTGLLFPFTGSGLSIGGTGKTFKIQTPISTGSNFNFSTGAGGAVVTMNEDFGTAYTPINNGAGTADTTSFSVTLAPTYNMSNIPMIFGTIAFWNGSQMNYNQLRFGNTNTTASVQAVITPTTANMSNTTGATAYGAPLTLTITGISKTSAFNGATNISSTSPTNYAIQLYLQISN